MCNEAITRRLTPKGALDPLLALCSFRWVCFTEGSLTYDLLCNRTTSSLPYPEGMTNWSKCCRWNLSLHFLSRNIFNQIVLKFVPMSTIYNKSALAYAMGYQWLVEQAASQCLNSLGPSDVIWRWRSGSTMVLIMACCLTHQAITWTNVDFSSGRSFGNHLRALSQEDLKIPISKARLKITFLKSH